MAESVATAGSETTHGGRFGWIDRTLVGLCLASLAVVVVVGFVQTRFGTYSMTWGEAYRAVTDPTVLFERAIWEVFLLGGELPGEVSVASRIVWTIRVPRVLVAVLVGMNLAVSGAIFQAVTRNELASPVVLGVSSGSGLAVLLTLVVFAGATVAVPLVGGSMVLGLPALLPLVAAVGGIVAFLLVYAIAWQDGTSPVRLVLAGVVVAAIFESLQHALFSLAGDIGIVKRAIAWTAGSLTGVGWEQVRIVLPWSVLAMGIALVSARQLNLLLLGERTASSLGMRVERVRFGLSAVAVLAAAASIAVAGIVSFVGLVVPHMVRTIVGSDYRRLIVGCLFLGPALMVIADLVARLGLLVVTGDLGQLPTGVVTGIVGGPYFLYLMRRQGELGDL